MVRNVLPIFLLLAISCTVYSNGIDIFNLKGKYTGQTVFPFLTLPVSASQLSGNISSLPGDRDASALPFAPASTAFLTHYTFAITHLEWFMGLRKEYAGASIPLFDRGTLGIYSQVFTLGDFDFARDINEDPIQPEALEFSVGLSYSRFLIYKKLALGGNINYIESKLDGTKARGFNISTDLYYVPYPWVDARGYIRHLGPKVTYSMAKEPQPLQMGISASLHPFDMIEHFWQKRIPIDLLVNLGMQKKIDNAVQLGASLVYIPPLKNILTIKTGYEYSLGTKPTLGGLSAGVAFNYKRYGIDAAWKYQSPIFGSVWAVTIRIDANEVVPTSANKYLQTALRLYNRKIYRSSIQYAQKALRINPKLWEAQNLIALCRKALERKSSSTVTIAYTGNIRGNYTSHQNDSILLGGISKQATLFTTLKNDIKNIMTLNIGNMIPNDNISPDILSIIDKFNSTVGFDIYSYGANEYQQGTEHNKAYPLSTPSFSVNTIETKNIGDFTVAVATIIVDKDIQSVINEGEQLLQSSRFRSAPIRIVVIDGTWKEIQQVGAALPDITCIIASSLESPFKTAMNIGTTPVYSLGSKGSYVGTMTFQFDKEGALQSFNNELIPVTNSIIPDIDIQKLVQTLNTTMVSGKGKPIEGIFTFMSDKRGVPHTYVKIMKKHWEYPLSVSTQPNRKPSLSLSNGHIAYITDKSDLRSNIHIKDIGGNKDYTLSLKDYVHEAVFTPQGNALFITMSKDKESPTDIYRVDLSTGQEDHLLSWPESNEQNLTFSPDGKSFIFTSNKNLFHHIYGMAVFNKRPIQITEGKANSYSPQFSPNSDFLAYISDKNNFLGAKDLWVYSVKKGKHTQLTHRFDVHSFCWLNGHTMILSAGKKERSLYKFNTLTHKKEQIIKSGYTKYYKEENPRIVSFNGQKYIIYNRVYDTGKRKVFIIDLRNETEQQITENLGNSWLE